MTQRTQLSASMGNPVLTGECHCGAVAFEVSRPPYAVACNCSICRRLATLWVHAPPATAKVNMSKNATIAYTWGDKGLAFHTCKRCGCTTHWKGVKDENMALNIRLCPPTDIADIPIRRFDGADSWSFIDPAP